MKLTIDTDKLKLEVTEEGIKGSINSETFKGNIDTTWEDLDTAFGVVRRWTVPKKALSRINTAPGADA